MLAAMIAAIARAWKNGSCGVNGGGELPFVDMDSAG
jgi:hypothetical protein